MSGPTLPDPTEVLAKVAELIDGLQRERDTIAKLHAVTDGPDAKMHAETLETLDDKLAQLRDKRADLEAALERALDLRDLNLEATKVRGEMSRLEAAGDTGARYRTLQAELSALRKRGLEVDAKRRR